MPRPAVVFAPLGPNPAPLVEMLWRLAKDGDLAPLEVHALVEQRGRYYLDLEVLAPGAALAQLRDALPAASISDLVVHEALDQAGRLIEDDAEPEARTSYVQALWSAARATVQVAADRPVVFGLVAGRRRTMTALQTAVFQLLARPQDRLLDVRVDDPRVEGGTGFFFPEQPNRTVYCKKTGEAIDARDVTIRLVPLDLPRLAPFVPPAALETFGAAKAATDAALAEAAPPKLRIDLSSRTATADGRALTLSTTELVWYAYLCDRRIAGDDEVCSTEFAEMQAFLRRIDHFEWWAELEAFDVLRLIHDEADDQGLLKSHRSYARGKLGKLAKAGPPNLDQIVPRWRRGGGTSFDRLPLSPAFIELVGL